MLKNIAVKILKLVLLRKILYLEMLAFHWGLASDSSDNSL